ncbi:hypothetical protein IF188_15635 [Microbacterium sp. NEAU-LLC]|uniref:DUF1311 domain-containing protein n=1 Tax=Microbacterium helvum TaxID=2773713 RepID=A0ABR8NR68_9MICO|nr:hypothetical protein [Microbacterium helvum]MBD3943125.1 hypothetical protein [Microbacterium helvum]
MTRIRPLTVAAVAALALPLAACASQPVATPELPEQDVAHWVMPLDEFWAPTIDALPNYTENLLVAECMGEEGIDWPIPWQPTDDASYLPPTANMSGMQVLTPEVAREYGYRAPANTGRSDPEGAETMTKLNAIAASTPGFEPLFGACLDEAREQVPSLRLNDWRNRLAGWYYESMEAAMRAPEVEQTGAAWQQCLQDRGYPVDLAAPLTLDEWMPSEELLAKTGVPARWQPGDGGPENPLSQAEVDLAVADAECRASSGWMDAFYQAMWDAQVELVAQHADELVRARDDWITQRDAMLALVAEHAPAH